MKTTLLQTLVVASVLFAILSGCSKEAVNASQGSNVSDDSRVALADNAVAAKGYKTYVIEAGNHYANGRHFPLYSGTGIAFTAIFDSSAIYNFTDPNTKYDQNTLYGFADNNSNHRLFSARFGWRWFDGQLQIAAYTFNNGDSTIVEMGTVPLNTAIAYSIAVSGDHYNFTLNDTGFISLPRASQTASAGRYNLLPYFGGDAVAPHKITVRIK